MAIGTGQNIFISYRRVDTEGYAGRIYDRLAERFDAEQVFMDVTDIGVGEDFADAIGQAISSCRVVIILMGPRWHTVTDEMGRKRLDDPHDFVHIEVKSALDRNVQVIPVLVNGASMPKTSDLPVDLAGLTRHNAIEIRHRRFDTDVEYLVSELGSHLGEVGLIDDEPPHSKLKKSIPIWVWLLITLFIVVMGLFGSLWLVSNNVNNAAVLTHEAVDSTLTAIAEVNVQKSKTSTPQPSTLTVTNIPSATSLPLTDTFLPTITPSPTLTPTETLLADQIVDPFGVVMILIPQGPFFMGTDGRELWDLVSRPAHLVSLDMYYIDQFEISNAQYGQCVLDGACELPLLDNSKMRQSYYSNSIYADYPVVYISWYDAQIYCSWRGGRLPNEVEWEKAARGEDQRPYPWGTEKADCQHANYWPTGACVGDTTAVTEQSAGASNYGVYNLSGNVAEWVKDWFQSYPGGDPNAAKDFGITHRTIRGGAYFDGPNNIRATARKGLNPEEAHSYVGFRCVVDIEALP